MVANMLSLSESWGGLFRRVEDLFGCKGSFPLSDDVSRGGGGNVIGFARDEGVAATV